MERKEYPEVEVTLKELLAAVLHGGRFVVILGLVLALLLGAYGAYSDSRAVVGPDADYQAQLEEYELTKETLEKALSRSEKELESLMTYLGSSHLMQIDPYNKYTSTMVFAISHVDASDAKDAYSVLESPASYMVSRIQAQYKVLWDGLNLENAAKGTSYEGVADKYLREVAQLEVSDGGVLKLTVMGSSEDTEKLAANLYAVLQEKETVVEQASYPHQFTLLTEAVTQTIVDPELEKIQQEKADKLEKTRADVAKDKAALAALTPPVMAGPSNTALKNVILGGAVGVVIACVWLVAAQLVSSKVSCAERMARAFGLTHFGSVKTGRSIWTMLSQLTMNERVWKNETQSLDFIREKGCIHLPESGTVMLLSTLPKVENKLVEKVTAALEKDGRKVVFAADMLHNPQALAGIRGADALVLLERSFATENAAVISAVDLAEEMEKPVCGFVMV